MTVIVFIMVTCKPLDTPDRLYTSVVLLYIVYFVIYITSLTCRDKSVLLLYIHNITDIETSLLCYFIYITSLTYRDKSAMLLYIHNITDT